MPAVRLEQIEGKPGEVLVYEKDGWRFIARGVWAAAWINGPGLFEVDLGPYWFCIDSAYQHGGEVKLQGSVNSRTLSTWETVPASRVKGLTVELVNK